ncbi:Arm DNA-binding domain-containing protein [Mesobacillus maritimus]|uniref:Arm DNA-binding domain-containing protein n=1 Tax=Mesobacillus maritimus TaxID=1643336 RepID=A0ABS7K8U2_9BACI|nr:Arm DNA-binding domain-containing protein [Mesobacillus maritimus]MBY0098687.1 Arm DNA-binding domain-containing protein [Mesobacillus maritimus]
MKGYIIKRGLTWTFQLDIGKDPITGKRLRKSVGGFKTKKECENALQQLLLDIQNFNTTGGIDERFSSIVQNSSL